MIPPPPPPERHYDLAGAEHDHQSPPRRRSCRPRRCYAICSLPRSGSSLLGEGLHATGLLGTPIEYLDPDAAMAELWHRWGVSDLEEYLATLHWCRSSGNGMFGIKLHWSHLAAAAHELAPGRPPLAAAAKALSIVAPAARLVAISRQDMVRQAVSWAVSERTRQWALRAGDQPVTVSADDYDFCRIRELLAQLEDQQRRWDALFAVLGVQPLRVTYERLARVYPSTVRRVATWLGADTREVRVPPPRLVRQANPLTEHFVARYLRDRERMPAS